MIYCVVILLEIKSISQLFGLAIIHSLANDKTS